jgi:hypothetical protein
VPTAWPARSTHRRRPNPTRTAEAARAAGRQTDALTVVDEAAF